MKNALGSTVVALMLLCTSTVRAGGFAGTFPDAGAGSGRVGDSQLGAPVTGTGAGEGATADTPAADGGAGEGADAPQKKGPPPPRWLQMHTKKTPSTQKLEKGEKKPKRVPGTVDITFHGNTDLIESVVHHVLMTDKNGVSTYAEVHPNGESWDMQLSFPDGLKVTIMTFVTLTNGKQKTFSHDYTFQSWLKSILFTLDHVVE